MALPTQKTKPKTDFLTTRTCIVGNPKVGKSTFASNLGPGVIFAATEQGLDFLSVFKKDINTYADFTEMVKELTTTKHNFHTVVVDVIDKLIEKAEAHICTVNKVQFIKDLPYGAGYTAVKRLIVNDLEKITNSGLGLTLITHAKDREFKTESIAWTATATSLSKSYEESILGLCDLILYCYIDSNNQRMIRTKPNKYVMCAGDRSTKLPEKMPMNAELVIETLKGSKNDTAKTSVPTLQA